MSASTPESRSALTAGKLPRIAAQCIGSVNKLGAKGISMHEEGILLYLREPFMLEISCFSFSKADSNFAPNDRTPSTLHTVLL